MKKSLLTLLVTLAILNAQAQTKNTKYRWTRIGKTTDDIYYMDNKRIKTKAGMIRVWVKTNINDEDLDFSGLLPPNNKGKTMGVIVGDADLTPPLYETFYLYELNCSQELLKIIHLTEYKSGKVERSINSSNRWDYVVPNSIGEVVFQQGCKEQRWKKKRN